MYTRSSHSGCYNFIDGIETSDCILWLAVMRCIISHTFLTLANVHDWPTGCFEHPEAPPSFSSLPPSLPPPAAAHLLIPNPQTSSSSPHVSAACVR